MDKGETLSSISQPSEEITRPTGEMAKVVDVVTDFPQDVADVADVADVLTEIEEISTPLTEEMEKPVVSTSVKYNLPPEKAVAEEWPAIARAIYESQLGEMLPIEVSNLIVNLRGRTLRWGLHGPQIELADEDGYSIHQVAPSNSAIANTFFSENSGTHVWAINVIDCKGSGCKYIGIVNATDITEENLNSNLQNGCRGRRVAFDGSCKSIYYDIDSYQSERLEISWKTGDVVTIYLDCNHRIVRFAINEVMVPGQWKYEQTCPVVPVVGCGPSNGERYLIEWCSWPNQLKIPPV